MTFWTYRISCFLIVRSLGDTSSLECALRSALVDDKPIIIVILRFKHFSGVPCIEAGPLVLVDVFKGTARLF